jgi:DNA topoisomerase IB
LNSAIASGVAAVQLAGLRYTSDEQPGIRRVKKGRGFTYVDRDGHPARDAADLPASGGSRSPAGTDVWISPSPVGHIQANGRDAKRRRQCRYHERWREVRDEAKYGRLSEFAKALPKIRARVDADLSRPGIPRERVLATVARLLEETLESEDVNQCLREISGEELSANDFRTWAGTIPAATPLAQLGPARSERIAREHIVQAIDVVASHLGTRAVCRKCYLHPAVLDAYIEALSHRRWVGRSDGGALVSRQTSRRWRHSLRGLPGDRLDAPPEVRSLARERGP